MSEENKDPLYGKPWKNLKNCRTYEEAFAEVQQILNRGEKVQTKIKRRSDDTFVVKTRSLEVPVVKSGKKKRNTEENT